MQHDKDQTKICLAIKVNRAFCCLHHSNISLDMMGVNRNTAAYYFQWLRKIIVYQPSKESHEVFAGEVEVDENYFWGTRKVKRGPRGGRSNNKKI